MEHLSPAQIERLDILAEECAEVIQVVCKIKRHGWRANGHDNRIALEHELGDVKWAQKLITDADDAWQSSIDRFAAEKPAKAAQWLHHQQQVQEEAHGA